MHRTITSGMLGRPRAGRTSGLTGVICRTVCGSRRAVGTGLDIALARLVARVGDGATTPEREALLAAINGVVGDRLAASGNPLAIPTPLLRGVDTLVVAATTKPTRGRLHDALVGDGVAPLASALGTYRRPKHSLQVPESRRVVATPVDHWDLLDHADVQARLCE
jgi:hypothetical protein